MMKKNLRVVPCLFVLLAGAVLGPGTFATPYPPVVVHTTLITGPDQGVSGPTAPGVRLADLDHGFAAGNVRHVYDGTIWIEVRVPFLWSEKDGTATLLEPPKDLVLTPSWYLANAMTPDGSTVVGGVVFPETLTTAPWIWTHDGSRRVDLLPIPGTEGGATAVTKDGRLVAGVVGGFLSPGRAVVWKDRELEMLPSRQIWSEVGSAFEAEQPAHQHAMNSDGSIIVGASGPAPDQMQATSWVHGVEQPLDTGPATSSVAMFLTDGGVIFGTGTLGDGRIVMMRWLGGGKLEILEAPDGLSVVNLASIDTLGHAAGGALAQRASCIGSNDPACNRAPFVWTDPPYGPRGGVFTILPEHGLEDFYTRSTVSDVSDDGQKVAGMLTAAVRSDGDPLDVAFVWSPGTGLVIVDDIVPQRNPDYYTAGSISRDGNRVLVTGNPAQPTAHDTDSVILDLKWP